MNNSRIFTKLVQRYKKINVRNIIVVLIIQKILRSLYFEGRMHLGNERKIYFFFAFRSVFTTFAAEQRNEL